MTSGVLLLGVLSGVTILPAAAIFTVMTAGVIATGIY